MTDENIYLGYYVQPFVMLDEEGWKPCISRRDDLSGLPNITNEIFEVPFACENDAKNISQVIADEQNAMIDRAVASAVKSLRRNIK